MGKIYEAAALVNVWLGEPGSVRSINLWPFDWIRIFWYIVETFTSNSLLSGKPSDLLEAEWWRTIASILLNRHRMTESSVEYSNLKWHERSW